jgi:hypothetical protein
MLKLAMRRIAQVDCGVMPVDFRVIPEIAVMVRKFAKLSVLDGKPECAATD